MCSMGKVLNTYHRYQELVRTGQYQRLTEVVDEDWVENCVGLTGWTVGLDVAIANFAAGVGTGFSELTAEEQDVVETRDTVVIRAKTRGRHTGRFLGVEPTGRRISWESVDIYKVGKDGRINWHFYVTDWRLVRLRLLGQAPDLPDNPTRRAVLAEQSPA
jgi:predicted ester cyclase